VTIQPHQFGRLVRQPPRSAAEEPPAPLDAAGQVAREQVAHVRRSVADQRPPAPSRVRVHVVHRQRARRRANRYQRQRPPAAYRRQRRAFRADRRIVTRRRRDRAGVRRPLAEQRRRAAQAAPQRIEPRQP
jgi:hypothetical protein